jgi:CAAX prenyl protease-related protein
MNFLRAKFAASPIYARVAPFIIFLVLGFCQTLFGESGRFWLYAAKTAVGAWLIWKMRPFVKEMRWAFSWEAIVVGIGVCAMWIGIDPFYPKLGKAGPQWNPHVVFGQDSGLARAFIVVRLLGSTFVVPPLEEVFYRSFLYRYFVRLDFQSMPFRQIHFLSFVVTAIIFGPGQHYQWLAGIFCGMAYQWLVLRKDRLGDAMTAHAITNFLLGIWVVWKGAWNFW